MKKYDLDVIMSAGDEGQALLSKGHHDFDEFMNECRAYLGEELEGYDPPRHKWLRVVPDSTGEYRCIYHDAEAHARGAFPVTIIERF